MPIHPKVEELLRRWQALAQKGTVLSAEELCRDHPEHLEELKRHIATFEEMTPTRRKPMSESMKSSASHRPIRTGEMPVLENYEVLEIIGKGGMGIVYKVEQKWPRRILALKMLRNQTVVDSEDLARFLREINTLCRLNHANIVHLYDAGHLNGYPYFTMEFVEGSNLSDRYKDKGCSPRRAARIVAILARAVESAHNIGILHRDLKPANILMSEEGIPKITDFGLAKRMQQRDDGHTPSHMVLGTPSYMAPEQAGSRPDDIGFATDVYGLGAVLYELLTGKPPFRGETPHETLIMVLTQEVVPPSETGKDIPDDLETICLKCLEKEPRNRYQTAKDLAEELDEWLREEPESDSGPSWKIVVIVLSFLIFAAAIAYRLIVK